MKTITFNCQFITPAFLGGADIKGTPEIRPPSIKGMLRFWWRSQCKLINLNQIKQKELSIFGGIDGDEIKKSSFSIRVYYDDFETSRELPASKTDVRNKGFKINIFEYLAFGTYERENKANLLNRDFVKPGQEFKITFTFFSNEYEDEVLYAFHLSSVFGGLGMKSRNGFGKFQIINKSTISDWKQTFRLLKIGKMKSFTSFSESTLCFQTKKVYSTVEEAWGYVGKAYKNAREFIERPHSYKYRSYISSPIIDKKKQTSFLDRHAKPYFITIMKEGEYYRGVIVFIPYLFLENASTMLEDLFTSHKKNISNMGIQLNDLRLLLVQTNIPVHQKKYIESNKYFHEELCHNENPYQLTETVL